MPLQGTLQLVGAPLIDRPLANWPSARPGGTWDQGATSASRLPCAELHAHSRGPSAFLPLPQVVDIGTLYLGDFTTHLGLEGSKSYRGYKQVYAADVPEHHSDDEQEEVRKEGAAGGQWQCRCCAGCVPEQPGSVLEAWSGSSGLAA